MTNMEKTESKHMNTANKGRLIMKALGRAGVSPLAASAASMYY